MFKTKSNYQITLPTIKNTLKEKLDILLSPINGFLKTKLAGDVHKRFFVQGETLHALFNGEMVNQIKLGLIVGKDEQEKACTIMMPEAGITLSLSVYQKESNDDSIAKTLLKIAAKEPDNNISCIIYPREKQLEISEGIYFFSSKSSVNDANKVVANESLDGSQVVANTLESSVILTGNAESFAHDTDKVAANGNLGDSQIKVANASVSTPASVSNTEFVANSKAVQPMREQENQTSMLQTSTANVLGVLKSVRHSVGHYSNVLCTAGVACVSSVNGATYHYLTQTSHAIYKRSANCVSGISKSIQDYATSKQSDVGNRRSVQSKRAGQVAKRHVLQQQEPSSQPLKPPVVKDKEQHNPTRHPEKVDVRLPMAILMTATTLLVFNGAYYVAGKQELAPSWDKNLLFCVLVAMSYFASFKLDIFPDPTNHNTAPRNQGPR